MRVLIAGGGTGGHIYPAIAIADALREIDPQSIIEFVGTPSGLEAKLVPKSNYKLHFISIGRLNRNVGLAERILTLLMLPIAILKGFLILRRFRPDVVLGVGGYASAPLVLAAAISRCQTYIWEPNAYPGLANRELSRFVRCCLVVFDEAAQFMKNQSVKRVHMPVRKEIEEAPMRIPRSANFRVLVFGGSQGARALNNALSEAIRMGGSWLSQIEIVHQTGPLDFERIKGVYDSLPQARGVVQVHDYLHNMPERYAWADLVVSRAGTGTISELAASGKAALLIPLPSAADDHQTKNAEALVGKRAAKLLPQKELTPERLIREIVEFKSNPEMITDLEQNIRSFHKAGAAMEIAKIMMNESEV